MTIHPPSALPSGTFPTSVAQLRMWLHCQRFNDSRAYVAPIALWLEGALDADALERSIATLIDRHDQLRTVFAMHGDKLVQKIQVREKPLVHRASIQASEVEEWLQREIKRGFDLERGPLIRATILNLAPEQHLFVITVHHIISDGWSMGLFIRDLGVAYRQETGEADLAWPAEAGRFEDAVASERMRLQSPEFGARLEAAVALLKDAPVGLPLPFEASPDRVESCATIRELIPDATADAVDNFARKAGVTTFVIYAATFAALLSLYSGQDEVVIGVPVAGRDDPTAAQTFGLFVNTMPLRLRFDRTESWSDLITRTREALLDAMPFGNVPIDRILAASGRQPLPALLVVQPNALPVPDLPGITAGWCFTNNHHTKSDITLKLDRAVAWSSATNSVEAGLFAALEYPASRQSREMAERMLNHFKVILEAMVSEPAAMSGNLDLCAPHDQALRDNCLRLEHPHPGVDPIAAFETQALLTPDANAVCHENQAISYNALAKRIGDFQCALVEAGVRPDDRVGVCLNRTPDLVAALFAILRMGASYVPLDPAYPSDRLSFILADTQCSLVLVQEDTRIAISSYSGALLDIASISPAPLLPPRVASLPYRTGYIISTSGSTGRPKGIAIPLQSFHTLIGWSTRFFSQAELSEVLASTSICFDMSVFEIFAPLSVGGSLRLVDNALALLDWPEVPVTLIDTVPSAIAEIIRAGALPRTVLGVNLGGEALPRNLVDRVHEQAPQARVVNLYGPSEDTTFSTWSVVQRGFHGEPTIGVTLEGTNAYVLDSRQLPVPTGVDGELYLGGAGVALGYFGRPDLTAEKFVPDPFSPEPGARMYATGDTVRVTPTGELRYLGRRDNQIKLRGFRIELGEIEDVLRRVPGVVRVQVVCREVNGEPHLVSYWTGDAAEKELRAAAAAALPEYMIPRFWTVLNEFPLNANGKIDRAALPEPATIDHEVTAPTSPIERMISEIFTDLTGHANVGRETDFFSIGGHSLLAMRLGAALRERTGTQVPLAELFRARTVSSLADWINAAQSRVESTTGASDVPKLGRAGVSRARLSFGQERMWLVERLRPERPMLNIAEAFRFSGQIDDIALASAIAKVTSRHDGLRLRIDSGSAAGPEQAVMPPDDLIIETIRSRSSEETQEILRAATAQSFDFTAAPPARWLVVREDLAESKSNIVVALIVHHLAADGFSLNLLFSEISAAYDSIITESDIALPPTLSIVDYAVWQRCALGPSPLVKAELEYWRAHLAGAPERLQLPFDNCEATQRPFAAARVTRRIANEKIEALAKCSADAQATQFMSMLALYHGWLSRISGQDDIIVGTPIASRDEAGSETIVGCLLNTLPIRLTNAEQKSFAQLVTEVRMLCLEAFANQHVPFELVIDALELPRKADHAPLIQTMLVFEGDPHVELRLGRSVGVPITIQPEATQFDLTLRIVPEAGGWTITWHYRADLFTAEAIECLADSFDRLMASATAMPHLAMNCLPMASWSDLPNPQQSGPGIESLSRLFDLQAEATPAAPAIRDELGVVSYLQLQDQVDALAFHLGTLGVQIEDRIAITLPRNRWAIISMLAVAKAGGTFLCLDPALPSDRRDWILIDAGVVLQISSPDLAGELNADLAPIFEFDAAALRAWGKVRVKQADDLKADHTAYIIYTSGSTGHPKGVMLPHRGLAQLARLHREAFSVGPGKQVLQYSPFSFDASIWECVMALLTGACLNLAAPEDLRPGRPLSDTLTGRRITHLTIPPSNLAMLDALPETVEHLILAGEPCPSDALSRWGANAQVWNAYGPTEATVCATVKKCTWDDNGPPTIGCAFAGAQAFVLDTGLNPLPPLVPGELFLGGDGLARGYVSNPVLTALSFLPHPKACGAGARLYRTGDLARRTLKGEIEFIGRRDDQVKLRGIRIELGEVEACILDANPSIAAAVALVIGPPAERILVAFVTGSEQVDAGKVREHLSTRLPSYMMPAWIEYLDELPLTPNGKLDRRSLAARAVSVRREQRTSTPPRGPVEKSVAAIWQKLLPDAHIGRADDFFAIGGNSLSLTRLHELLSDHFETRIGVVDLFRLNTVAAIAEAILHEQADVMHDAEMFSYRL